MTFGVDAEAVISCGREISGLAGKAGEIKAAAEKARVPEQSWGLLGQALTYSEYVGLMDGFMEHMDKMVESMTKVGDQLSLTGEHYRDVNDAVRDALDELSRKLDAAPSAPKVGG
ncbi:hypothetical protein [Lentzea flava]|uniref:Excreted virulence factor EspC, type VII ESX diderm n=1 Tax=Lentzea flava TaxID=103732 RepID=A0ABQ2VF84_9PSEU|nr:hypothetical protein [Lentzea flava]MCP2205157.1 hypothetical protein [Lentzea flava]GGU84046.1 hypothetical protein GCM10010178_87960 [Lentzea flava]